MQRTALFAGEAVVDSEILTTVLKDATKRLRPADIQAGRNYSDSWFESGCSLVGGRGSFSSGHTIAAFSVATIVARRYGNHKWIPYASYGMATLVGFSRLSSSAHFLSDVFMGGALGSPSVVSPFSNSDAILHGDVDILRDVGTLFVNDDWFLGNKRFGD